MIANNQWGQNQQTASYAFPVTSTPTNGMLSIYLDPVHFGAQDFAARTMEYVDYVKSSPAAEGTAEVLAPGEPEARNRVERQAKGIPLQLQVWTNLCNLAASLGLAVPG